MNWYPEFIESQTGKTSMALYPCPGENLFATVAGGGPGRQGLEINGRSFAIIGTNFVEILQNATVNIIGQVANDLLQASMVASPQQVLIAAGGNLYVYQLQTQPNTNGTVTVPGNPPPANLIAGLFFQVPNTVFTLQSGGLPQVSQVEFIDSLFLVLFRNSQQINISSPLDATSWPPLQFIVVSVFSDNVLDIIENQRRLIVLGRKRVTQYYNSTSPSIFDVDPSATGETGIISPFASCRADNTVFYLDQDERGAGIVRKLAGYTPQRISTHAIEFAIRKAARTTTINDAEMYSYQEEGHTFIVLQLPTAGLTWVYDVATGYWHQRGYWNIGTATFSAHKSRSHFSAFGKHLVLDPGSGNIYQMELPQQQGGLWTYVTDNGNTIRRVRRAPHVGLQFKRMFYSELEIDVETGLAPIPPLRDGSGNPRGAQLILRWSRDYSKSWGPEIPLDCGLSGELRKRVRKTKMGSSKTGMVFEISATDPIGWYLINGYLDAMPGYGPTERVVKQYGKVA